MENKTNNSKIVIIAAILIFLVGCVSLLTVFAFGVGDQVNQKYIEINENYFATVTVQSNQNVSEQEPRNYELEAIINAKDLQECEDMGGAWELFSPYGNLEGCNPLSQDAGQACSSSADCDGFCDLKNLLQEEPNPTVGICSERILFSYGCQAFLDDKGEVQMLCSD